MSAADHPGSGGGQQALGHPILNFLRQALLEPERPLRAIFVGYLAAFLPSLALGALVAAVFPASAQPQFDMEGAVAFFMVVAGAPILETLIMGGVLTLLLLMMSAPMAVGFSALGWGLAHSLAAPAWGLVIWWPFLIFSTLFVVWRKRSYLAAFAVPACAHALQNLIPGSLIFWGS